ncbi:unnamed protein product [Clavelina lepadiformis]|uniref:Uncharacterized protein n=1 Tax=Clavelina lepadiformis TaxID=159417 RepID=A0ABP0FRQ7_CLALP
MHSADQSSPKEPEEASASGSFERPIFISTITTETFYPLPDGETCQSFIGGSPRNPIPCSFFDSFKDDDWRETSYSSFLIAFGVLGGLVCLGFLIYVIKTAIKGGDQNEHAQDREHDVEMKVIERSRSPEVAGEGRCGVAEIEDQQSLPDTSEDESTQGNRNEIVVHALVERAQDDEVEYQDEYQELQLWDETSSQGYQAAGEGRCGVAEIEDQQSLPDTSEDESTQEDREHNVEMKVIDRSRSPEAAGEGRCGVAEIEDQQSLPDTSEDESTQEDKREVVEHAAVERTEEDGQDKQQRNRNEIVVHALVERSQDDEVEYQDEYQELSWWDETSSQGYQSDKV